MSTELDNDDSTMGVGVPVEPNPHTLRLDGEGIPMRVDPSDFPVKKETPVRVERAKEAEPEPAPQEENMTREEENPMLSQDLLDDGPVIEELEEDETAALALAATLPVSPVDTPREQVGPEGKADGEEGKEDEAAPEQAINIWDAEDFPPKADPENFRHLAPAFQHIDEPLEGCDIALSPSSRAVCHKVGQAKGYPKSDSDYYWWLAMEEATRTSPIDNVLVDRVARPNSDWAQTFNLPNSKMRLGFLPNAYRGFSTPGTPITGIEALDRFNAGTSLGSPITVPLPNTGIWVKLGSCSASLLAAMDRALAYAKAQVGLDTNGFTGSTEDLIFREIINEFALKQIVACNFEVRNPLELREIIDVEDMRVLEWALAKVMYPKGIKIAIPCISPTCSHVDTVLANPSRMFTMDRSRLSEKQLAFLSRGVSKKMTLKEVMEYKEEFKVGASRCYTCKIGNSRRDFYLRNPTIADYLQLGRAWLNSINTAVDLAMEAEPGNEYRRADLIESTTSTENICRYAHYIEEIRIYNESLDDDVQDDNYGIINEPEDIRAILRQLATETDIVIGLTETIEKFITEVGVSIIGYPNIPCSQCQHKDAPEELKNKLLLPFDAAVGFFILAQRKITQAGGTPLVDLQTFGVGNFLQQITERKQQEYLQKHQVSPISNPS